MHQSHPTHTAAALQHLLHPKCQRKQAGAHATLRGSDLMKEMAPQPLPSTTTRGLVVPLWYTGSSGVGASAFSALYSTPRLRVRLAQVGQHLAAEQAIPLALACKAPMQQLCSVVALASAAA